MKYSQDSFLIAQAPAVGESGTTATTAPADNAPAGGAGQESPDASAFGGLLFPVLLIAVFYFLLIRPQQKKEKQRQAMLKEVAKGDKVLTRGGIWGTVVGVKDEEGKAIVKIADNVKVELAINAIEMRNPSKDEVEQSAKAKK